MNIGSVGIGAGYSCRTIAELSNSHNGDLDTALAMIGAAKEAEADIVKIQAFTVAELVALRGNGPAPPPWDDKSMAELYEQALTPLKWLPRLFREAARFDIPMFASVFGKESLMALEDAGCPAFKVSHFEADKSDLVAMIRETGKPFILSSAKRWGNADDENVMYCPGGYPATLKEMRLWNLNDTWVGLSSHCMDPKVPVIAVTRGAHSIEMHFHLSWRPSKLEAAVSLTEIQWGAMVRAIRETERALG